jgi:hypothetical protein
MLRSGGLLLASLGLVLFVAPAAVAGNLKVDQHISGVEKFNPQVETVRFFEGIDAGKLEIRVTAEGPNQCRFRITNKTESALNVMMPAAFAAVPVTLVGVTDEPIMIEDEVPPPDGDEPPPEGDDLPPPEDPQKLGIGCPYADGSEINTFCFIPGRTAQLQLRSVCLEHDRPGPSPKHHYEVRPMDQVTNIKGVYEICAMMGRGEIDHQVAQVAAWHLNNQITWRQLWDESQHGPAGAGPQTGMSRRQLFDAIEAVEKAVQQAWGKVTSLRRSAHGTV